MERKEIEKRLSESYSKLRSKKNALGMFIQEFNGIYEESLKDSEPFIKIREEISSLSKDYDDLVHELVELQTNCDHDFVWNGHDSHNDFYKCRKCGIIEQR